MSLAFRLSDSLRLWIVPAIIFLASLNSASANPGQKELHLGVVLSLSGAASPHGVAMREGVDFAVSQLKEDGWTIDLKFEDDGTEAKRTVSAVERLSSTGYRFFVGPTWGLLAEPAAPVFARTHSISMQPGNSSEFVSGGNGNFFFFLTPVRKYEPVLTEWLKSGKYKKVAILIADSPWGELHKNVFKKVVQNAGAEIVFDEGFQYGEENTALPPIVTKLKAKAPEVILTTSSKEITAQLVKHLERQQYRTAVLSPDLGDAVLEKLLPAESDWVEGYFIRPESRETFKEKFRSWKNRDPLKYADTAYDSVMALAEAVEKAGAEPAAVKSYLETKLDKEGASGRLRFDKNHDQQDGGYVIIEKIARK